MEDHHREFVVGAILSWCAWTLVYNIAPFINGRFLPRKMYRNLVGVSSDGAATVEEKKKANREIVDWDSKLPTFLHSVFAGALATYCCFFDKSLMADKIAGTSFAWKLTTWNTVGFFIWDFILHFRYQKIFGMPMLLHAVLGLATYTICGTSKETPMAWHACSLLLFELTTPVMIARICAIKLSGSKAAVQAMTNLFGLSFFVIRMVWGNFYAFPQIWSVLLTGGRLPAWKVMGFWIMTFLSAGLNTYWMYRLGRRIFGSRGGKKEQKRRDKSKTS